jgi:ATP-dependent phosphofructokinase / diphosphate-dependent phosphofructokinase
MQKDMSHVEELEIASLSRIHFEGGSVLRTSRANSAGSAERLQNVAESLQHLGASYLVTTIRCPRPPGTTPRRGPRVPLRKSV